MLKFKDFVNERKFTEEKCEQDAEKGLALPNGSFPIENKQDLENAIKAHWQS